jgi:hypothetical protein
MTTLSVHVVLLILGFVFLILAAANVPANPRLNWGWLGMALWLLATLLVR